VPFTLAHPAAVVPLRRVLVLSALVAGSLAPDFHYFLDLGPPSRFTHSIPGAFVFCLPVSLMLLWIFQRLMKLPLLSLAPEAHRQRLCQVAEPFRWGPAPKFALILVALLVGIFSHLAWDAFTHDRGFAVRNFPDLRAHALEDFGSQRPLYNVLQHASSLLGMTILAFWYWRWFKRTPPQPVPAFLRLAPKRKKWTIFFSLVLAGALSLVYAYIHSDGLDSRSVFVGTFATSAMSVVLIEAFLFSLWWHRKRNREIGSSYEPVIGQPITDDAMPRSPDHPIAP
jgi:hypothetical protein